MKMFSLLERFFTQRIRRSCCIKNLYRIGFWTFVLLYSIFLGGLDLVYGAYIRPSTNLSNYDTPAGFYFQYKPSGVACGFGQVLLYSNDANEDSTPGDTGWICADEKADGHSLDSSDGSVTDAVFVDNAGQVGIGTLTPIATLHNTGSFARHAITIINDYAIQADDNVLFVDSSSQDISITLPTAVGISGKEYLIKVIEAENDVFLQPASGETIDGTNTYLMSDKNDLVGLISDGTRWLIHTYKEGADYALITRGDGADGNQVISSSNTVVNDYTYLTGNESSGVTILTVNDASAFSAGDEILIHQTQDSTNGNAGKYEFVDIQSVSGNDITLESGLLNDYYSGTFNALAAQVTQVVRVPNYTDVTIQSGGSVTALPWNGFRGGIVVFRSTGDITFDSGTSGIDVSGLGFRGGDDNGGGNDDPGDPGEGYLGLGWDNDLTTANTNPNGNGGGGGYGPTGYGGTAGGGGGNKTAGGNAIETSSPPAIAQGGEAVGNAELSLIHLGGGGGGGGDNDNNTPPALGGNGGGIVILYAQKIVKAVIDASGTDGASGGSGAAGDGGGGAGGVVDLKAFSYSTNVVDVTGGDGGNDGADIGGAGGVGWFSGGSGTETIQDNHSLDSPGGGLIDVVYVNNDGNVGIGTTLPTAQLEVSGDMVVQNNLQVTGTLSGDGSSVSMNENLDIGNNELLNTRIENLNTAPTCDASTRGRLYHNTTDNKSYICNGSLFVQIDGGVGGTDTDVSAVSGALVGTDLTVTVTENGIDYDSPAIDLSSLQDGIGTDDQTIDVFNLTGTTLNLSLESDGQPDQTVDLAPLQDGYEPNTDNQDLSLAGNTLSLTNDATTVDLSAYLDNTDAQDLSLAGNTLSLTGDGTTVDLSSYLDDTTLTDGDIAGFGYIKTDTDVTGVSGQLTGTDLTVTVTEDGTDYTSTNIDLSSLQDGTGTDTQDLTLTGNILSLTNDATTVDLSAYLDNTDAQDLALTGDTLSLTGDGTTVDLSGYMDDTTLTDGDIAGFGYIKTETDDQTIDTLSLTGTTLNISLESDGQPDQTLDLSPLQDGTGTDNQDLTLTGNTLSLTNDTTTVDLSPYLDNTDAQDLSLAGNILSLTGDGTTVDLSGYLDNTDVSGVSGQLTGTDLTMTVTEDGVDYTSANIDLSSLQDGTGTDDQNWSEVLNGASVYMDYRPNNIQCSVGEILKYTDDANGDTTTGDFGWICATETADGHSLDSADGSITDAVFVDNAGQVGIGTAVPGAELDIDGELIIRSFTTAGVVKSDVNGLLTGGNGITGSEITGFTAGSIPYASATGITEDNTNFFWDSTNSYLGLGDNTPGAQFVVGDDTNRTNADGVGDVYIQNDLEIDGTLYGDGTGILMGEDIDLANNQLLQARVQNLPTAPTCDGTTTGLIYHNTTSNQSYVCNGSVFVQIDAVASASQTLSAIQIRQSADFAIPVGGWGDISFDSTDIENDPSTIIHNTGNTDRIDILADGLYQITYDVDLLEGAASTDEARVRVNDTTVLNGSYARTLLANQWGIVSADHVSNTFFVSLSAGDFVTFQMQTNAAHNAGADAIFSIVKLDGIQGPAGPAGADGVDGAPGGTTVDIEDDLVTILSNVDSINFGANLTVTDDGGNQVTIDASGTGGGTVADLAVVQARRTTDFTLAATNTWYDVPLDTTDIENDSTVIEHNVGDTDRIDVKSDGLYRVTYHVRANDAGATHTINTRVRANDTTLLNGSLLGETNYQGEYGTISGNFVASLTAGDFVTLQVERTTANTVVGETLLTVTKLEGLPGPAGADGAPGGTTVDVQQNDSVVASNVDALNFEGSVSVVDEGAGKVTVTVSGSGGSTANIFYAYDGAGGTAVTQTASTLNIDTTVVNDSAYTLAGDVVTFNQDGLYKVTARLTVGAVDQSGTQRSSVRLQGQKAIGGGAFSNISGAQCQDYMREQSSPTNSSASCSITFFESFATNDRLQFLHQAFDSTTSATISEGSAVTIEFVR